jgi:hypothetical protein
VLSWREGSSGPWTDITQPAGAAYVRTQLELAASIAMSAGAKVGLATAPCLDTGEQPDGRPWPEDSPTRLRDYNRLVASVASEHPAAAFVADLASVVCPGGRFHQSIGGVTVRAPDGIHYPFFSIKAPDQAEPDTVGQVEAFGAWVAARLERYLPAPATG